MDVDDLLAEMALQMERAATPDDVLQLTTEYSLRVTGASDAGIMLTHSRREVETLTKTDDRVVTAHRLQGELDEGPCLDAIDGESTYVATDLRHDERWPAWGPAAIDIGIHSAIGVRLATLTRGYGSLDVYGDEPGALRAEDARVVELLAAHATAALAAKYREQQLDESRGTRSTIGQAQGILMERFGIDADGAFSYLRRLSQSENVRLASVAEAIVAQRVGNTAPPSP